MKHYDTLTKYNLNAIIYSLNLSLARADFARSLKERGIIMKQQKFVHDPRFRNIILNY